VKGSMVGGQGWETLFDRLSATTFARSTRALHKHLHVADKADNLAGG